VGWLDSLVREILHRPALAVKATFKGALWRPWLPHCPVWIQANLAKEFTYIWLSGCSWLERAAHLTQLKWGRT